MESSKDKLVSIGEASRITGLSVRQLRYFQAKGYIREPVGITCGVRTYRYYTPDDLQILAGIKKFLDEGFTLEAAVKRAVEDQKIEGGI